MAASMDPSSNMFLSAVDQVLKSWPALHLAVEQGFGGPESREKADWMTSCIDTWFRENDGIFADEVEDFLNDVLNTEFDLRVEDGSVIEISRQICLFYQLCQQNNTNEIQSRLQALPKPNVSNFKQATDEDVEEMDSDGEGATPSTSQQSEHTPSSSFTQHAETTEEMEADQEEEDGWKVKRKGRRKK